MWICLSDGFLSIAADKDDPTRLKVRARRKEHLVNIFGKDAEVIKTPGSDYRWRVFVGRAELKTLVNRRIDRIEYTSFQDSVKDGDLDEMYKQFWNIHHRHQDQDVTKRMDDRRSHFVWGAGTFVVGKPKKSDFGHFPGSFQSLCSTGTKNPGQVRRLMIRLSEWCLLTGTPQATAYKLAASGKIPGLIRIGNTIRISTAALTEQIAAAQPAAGTQA